MQGEHAGVDIDGRASEFGPFPGAPGEAGRCVGKGATPSCEPCVSHDRGMSEPAIQERVWEKGQGRCAWLDLVFVGRAKSSAGTFYGRKPPFFTAGGSTGEKTDFFKKCQLLYETEKVHPFDFLKNARPRPNMASTNEVFN